MKTTEDKKTYPSVEEMFSDMETTWAKDYPIKNWIDEITKNWYWPFPYAHHVLFTNPYMIIEHFYYEIKYGFQRMFRGWDDKASWGIDWWLNDIMPDILKQLKNSKQGTPMSCFPDDYNGLWNDELTKEEDERIFHEAKLKWNKILDEIILGFESGKKINSHLGTLEEEKELQKTMNNGLKLFIEYYQDLWD